MRVHRQNSARRPPIARGVGPAVRIVGGAIAMLFSCVVQALGSIEGVWTTLDEQSTAPRATVEISVAADEWIGRVTQLLDAADENRDARCVDCPGAARDRPIVGLDILHVRASDGHYEGSILDPESGIVYRCTVDPAADGKSLRVRGYVGVPVLGRAVTWIRAPGRPGGR